MLGDDEEYEDPMPFEGMEKTTVLQECREFSAVTVNVPRCLETITKVLNILSTGHTLTQNEATDVFFGATKLFQCDHQKLRRLLYVLLKELSTVADQVFIASSSLVKDISSNNDMYKCNAIRTLRLVTDSTMIGPMERYLRQSVVDKNTNVVSAAVVTGIHLSAVQPEMVKRWGTEVSEALKSRGHKAQYHSLALLHKLRKSDRISVMKLVQQATSGAIRSPMALCLLIKLATELMQEDFSQSLELYKFVSNMTHNGSEAVVFEAARSLCSLRNITAKEIMPAVLVLQLYLTSHRPVLRFAAVRLLSKVASVHPGAVSTCNIDLEQLISDPNRNIGTLAITTLLKTGNEYNVERLLKQITTFMSDLSDEFKVVVVESVKLLTSKFPDKFQIMLQFLADALKDEGSAELKRSIVETIISIVNTLPAARDVALTNLAEFIEDCEYNVLVQRVLFLIAEHGPSCQSPQKYIRYVNNRIALEQAPVRATAIATLAKLAARCPELRSRVVVLLKRATNDPDDEVRDRAVLYHKILASGDDYVIKSLILEVTAAVSKERENFKQPTLAAAVAVEPVAAGMAAAKVASTAGGSEAVGVLNSQQLSMRDMLRKIPQLRALGEPAKTTEITMLTEADNEYVVGVMKHIYPEKVVLQFSVQNTMEEQSLVKVMVNTDLSELEVTPEFAIPIPSIAPGSTGYAYVVFSMDEGTFPTGNVSTACSFAMVEAGAAEAEAGDAEEFPMDEFALNMSDYILPKDVGSFDAQFDAQEGNETSETYVLATMKNLTQAAHEFCDFYGMYIYGGRPEKVTSKSQVIDMAGVVTLSDPALILLRGKVFLTNDAQVALTLTIRGGAEETRELLSAALVS